MRSSRPKIATTTAKDNVLLMKIIPVLIPLMLVKARSVVHFKVLLLPRVQKCQSPKSFPFVKSQWPSHTAMDNRTMAIATQRIIKLLIKVSKNDFFGLLRVSNHWVFRRISQRRNRKKKKKQTFSSGETERGFFC